MTSSKTPANKKAPAKSPTPAKTQAPAKKETPPKKEAPAKKETAEVLRITAINGPFRRCGHTFPREGAYYAPSLFDDAAAERLANEPRLSIVRAEIDPANADLPYITE